MDYQVWRGRHPIGVVGSDVPDDVLTLSHFLLRFLTLEVAMSDGPHRSLPMHRAWREVSKRADQATYTASDVCEAMPDAIIGSWKNEVSGALANFSPCTMHRQTSVWSIAHC